MTSPATSDFSDQRRSDRDEVFLRTVLAVGKKNGISAQLVNMSAHGFMARTIEPMAQDAKLRILLPFAGEVSAIVVWSLGGRIGCSFEIPFEDREYPKVLAAIKTAKPNWQFATG
jgi:PilZ domain.